MQNGYEFVNDQPVLRPDYDYERIRNLAGPPDSVGAREATIAVPRGETAWHPASTKHVLHGPVTVHYTIHADGGVNGEIIAGEVLR